MTVPIAQVTVTASYVTPSGSAAVGTVTFVPSATSATPGYLLATAIAVPLVDGALSVDLYATDDPDWLAAGFTYRVTERIHGARPRSYSIVVPAASPTLDLALVAPVVDPAAVTAYLLTSQLGVALGVASLDAGGQVPLSQLGNAPTGGGGGGAVDSVFGRTGVVVAQTGDYTKAQVGLSNVDNTADSAKPVSTAQATADTAVATAAAGALAAHEADTTAVHGIASTAALATTAAVAAGYQPLDSDLTTIAGLAATTDNVIQSVGSAWASRTPAQVKATLALAKGDVGLGNVDNTSDAAKPISTLTQAALDAKQALDSDLTTIAGLTATTDNIIQSVGSAWASRTPAQVKTALALNNLDNTSDAGKPVSSATQTALNLKADLASPTFTGTPAAPTAAAATSTTQLATTAFVTTADNLKANIASPTFTGTVSGITAAMVAAIANSLVDAKGDILTATANDTPARLAVGADTFVLTADSSQATGIKWAAAAGGSGTDYKVAAKPKTGLWYRAPSFGPVGSNLSMATLNRCYFVPFRLAATTTFDRIGVDVATAGTATAVLRLGIYSPDAAGDLPGTLILDAGTVAGDSTGAKQATISQSLAAGTYWLCVANQVASGTAIRAIVSYDPLIYYASGASMFTGTQSPGSMVATGITGAFASNPTISDNDNGPIIGVRAA